MELTAASGRSELVFRLDHPPLKGLFVSRGLGADWSGAQSFLFPVLHRRFARAESNNCRLVLWIADCESSGLA